MASQELTVVEPVTMPVSLEVLRRYYAVWFLLENFDFQGGEQ